MTALLLTLLTSPTAAAGRWDGQRAYTLEAEFAFAEPTALRTDGAQGPLMQSLSAGMQVRCTALPEQKKKKVLMLGCVVEESHFAALSSDPARLDPLLADWARSLRGAVVEVWIDGDGRIKRLYPLPTDEHREMVGLADEIERGLFWCLDLTWPEDPAQTRWTQKGNLVGVPLKFEHDVGQGDAAGIPAGAARVEVQSRVSPTTLIQGEYLVGRAGELLQSRMYLQKLDPMADPLSASPYTQESRCRLAPE